MSTPQLRPSITPKSSSNKKASKSEGSTAEKHLNESVCEDDVKEWTHEKLDWLKAKNIRDKAGKLKTDPTYNPQTLFVPDAFKKVLTPGMRQWWDLKLEHYDTVLFFKVGKFYELYHMDAVVAVKELGLTFMKGEFAHSGFPEIAFGRFSGALVDKGYKVARIEQTETPQMMEERCKKTAKPTKFDRVVSREICQITTKGTRTLTYQAENIGFVNNYLLTICEKESLEPGSPVEFGICFVDTSIGSIHVGQFTDDKHASRLLTLFALHTPVEVLYDKSSVSKKTLKLLSNSLCSARIDPLCSNSQFWDSQTTLKFMEESGYFKEPPYHPIFSRWLEEGNRAPLKEYDLSMRSLGACIWYLKSCCIEDCILTLQKFEHYIPIDQNIPDIVEPVCRNMVLDGVTLQNLEIVPLNSSDNAEGTLLGTIDQCSTNMGKRILRQWLCSPSCVPEMVSTRLDAIDDLFELPELVSKAVTSLKKLPDLERLLTKIHTYGLSRTEDHPDTRAVFYESVSYNKRKIADFLSALKGFRIASDVFEDFAPYCKQFKSKMLMKMASFENCEGGSFPVLTEMLEYFDNAFDHESAKSAGSIIPRPGVDTQYDTSTLEIDKAQKDLNVYLEKQKKTFSCKVSYISSGKNRYLLELPDNKKVPNEFEFQGGRKGFKRYYTREIKGLLSELIAAEERRNAALKDITRKIFYEFGKKWSSPLRMAITCISWVDVLLGLTLYRKSSSAMMCRPNVLKPNSTEPFLEIIDGQHPTFLKYFTGDDYIPNSVFIGPKKDKKVEDINDGGKVILVTGPNMGGKSTLMRQAGSLVILAQLGSYVPALSMSLTPVDRIFTRVGASDKICKGESTFFAEASETASILQHATSHSLVLMDELGRGTATYDGTAIACSVLKHLADDIGCRTLFSTHYHSLVEDFYDHPFVGLGHMACMVENDSDCPALEKITFLYKFVSGACPKSYGFNVALLAGVLKHIVQEGYKKAQEVEFSTRIAKSLRKLLSLKKTDDVIRKFCDNSF